MESLGNGVKASDPARVSLGQRPYVKTRPIGPMQVSESFDHQVTCVLLPKLWIVQGGEDS